MAHHADYTSAICPICGKTFKTRFNEIYCCKECEYEAEKRD